MYHADRPDIIEGSDILGLLWSEVVRRGERVFATIQVELNPSKDYPNSNHLLHVTNGVNPRLLIPSHEDISPKAAVKSHGVSSQAAVEKKDKG